VAKRIIEPKMVCVNRLVKSEDLNHHKTLFAGRTAEWFVEAGFLAAAKLVNPQGVVCLKIHGMYFSKPVYPGEIIEFKSKIVYAGRSSLVAYVQVFKDGIEETLVEGFITFIYVDDNTKPVAHNIEITAQTCEDMELRDKAKSLTKHSR
jgi:acyl-CoA hydrolase